jgi:aerobic-type carbon monoxide dehydrogenase small subunit (CoxS/CutS family)
MTSSGNRRSKRPPIVRQPAAVSRRAFLKGLGIGGGAVGTGLLGAGVARAQAKKGGAAPAPGTRLGPGEVTVAFKINGRPRTVKAEPRATLLDLIRDRLDLTGTKKICDRGECGGCTVILDGRPVYACMLPALDVRGRSVTTIEGIGAAGRLHPLQEAFIEKDALQCGFCTPGFVVAAKALLDRTPSPTAPEVREALGGHLCRCGTYTRIVEAVMAAAGRRPGPPQTRRRPAAAPAGPRPTGRRGGA